MAKRQQEVREPTKKQAAWTRRDRERRKWIVIALGIVLGAVFLILGVGILQQLILEPNSAVATVDGTAINTRAYQARVKYERNQVENQLIQYQQLEQQFDPEGTSGFFSGQIQQLQQDLSNPETFGLRVLDNMIDEVLISREAGKLGIAVDPAALQTEVQRQFGYEPDATPTPITTPPVITSTQVITNAAGITETQVISATATPQPTPTPYTEAEYQRIYNETLANIKQVSGLEEADFRAIIGARMLRDLVQQSVTADTPATEEQVRAAHILVSVAQDASEEDKTAARAKIDAALQEVKDGRDFAEVAKEVSDDSSAGDGGDLGWFGRGRMVAEFENAAFSLEPGEVSEVVETQFGYHIIKVLEKDAARPLEGSALESKRSQAFEEWLQGLRTSAQIVRSWNTNKLPPTPLPRVATSQ